MSSLTIEMGLSRRRSSEPLMPERLASRDDMTLAQKQRLAILSKMGVGPLAEGPPAMTQHTITADSKGMPPLPGANLAIRDRRLELLDKERKLREQAAAEEDAAEEMERLKRAKRRPPMNTGIVRLGPVMPREDSVPQAPPMPAQVPEPKQWTLKISKDTAERAAKSSQQDSSAGAEAEDDEAGAEERAERERERQVMEQIRIERQRRAAQAKIDREKQEKQQQKPKAAKKKKKRKARGDEEDWEEYQEGDSEEEPAEERGSSPTRGGTGEKRPMMVVESVKGKVSNANKNLTDADLERRFSANAGDEPAGSLMSEEQVLRIIRKEKAERGAPTERGGASASRRVQRELDEWADKKAQQRARVKSPHRFERMVIARK